MEKILKMLFLGSLFKNREVSEIKSIGDLCKAAFGAEKVTEIFAAMNDDKNGLSTEEILKIANEAYQEVCGNE